MSIKSNKAKGKELEDHIASRLRSSGLDPNAIRQLGSGSGKFKGDVHNAIGWCFEAKNTARFNWKEAQEQVEREGMGYQKSIIIWHAPRTPLNQSVAIINFEDFIELLKGERRGITDMDKIPKYLVNKVREELRQLLKYLGN